MKKIKSFEKANNIKNNLGNSDDIIIRQSNIGNLEYCLIFIDGICDIKEINLSILGSIQEKEEGQLNNNKNKFTQIYKNLASFCEIEIIKDEEIEEKVLKGNCVFILDDEEKSICFKVAKYESRGIEEPPNSTVINGPREGFTENIKTNLSLIRKRLVSNKLRIKTLSLGERTNTTIKLVYFYDIVDKKVVSKIENKLNSIKVDGIIDSFYVGTILEDRPNSMFRQVGNCEKPDIACAKILEGRVAILVDGSPIALTIPFIALEDFQSSNDYYSEAHRATILRILRVIALFISIYLPGLYIALQLFHYKVLPLKFLLTIIQTTQNLPLNPFLEIFFIIILFDILFEASIRMPKYLGIAVSIVGALILGDTAVKAGLVSPPGVMIVAMSAITIYILPNQSAIISTLRIVFAFIGGVLGFHGLILGTILLFAYLSEIDSFGTPYLAPFAPYIISDQKDAFVKDNYLELKTRPKSFPNNNRYRIRK